MKWLRRIAPWILLATYLPLVTLSSVHIHHDTVDLHDDCLQCAGHFEAQHHHDNDCPYCHFLCLSYLGQDTRLSTNLLPATEHFVLSVCEPTAQLRYGVSLLRAPPAA